MDRCTQSLQSTDHADVLEGRSHTDIARVTGGDRSTIIEGIRRNSFQIDARFRGRRELLTPR